MDKKKFFNILLGVILLIIFLTPMFVNASDCELVFEKGRTIVPDSSMDEISQYMYKDGKYSYYTIYCEIDSDKILLDKNYEFTDKNIKIVQKTSKIICINMNSDNISDYVIVFPMGRRLDNCYIVDGKSQKIIFSSEWRELDRSFDTRHFKFGQNWIVEEVQMADPDANDPGTKYIYYWSAGDDRFILKEKR